jgi:MATE family multidrug resistance protein
MAHALDALAHAAEALGGRAIGAGDRQAFSDAVKASMFWALIVAAGFSGVYLVLGPSIVALLTGIDEVRATAEAYIWWSIAMPVVAVFPFVLDGVFLGATQGRIMRNAMIASLAIYLACCFLLIPIFGNDGLWAALLIFMGARGITLGIRYPRLEKSIGD